MWNCLIFMLFILRNENLTKALVDVIQKAPSGSCWLVEGAQPAKQINIFP